MVLLLAAALQLPVLRAADNGRGLLPPMAWRSWNAFYASIDEKIIRAQIDALVEPRDPATGAALKLATFRGTRADADADAGVSLRSLGYRSIGIDEGWEGCGLGVNGTVHLADGTPTVDPKRFPSGMKSLVDYGHNKGADMGFYLNGCGCTERVEKDINYVGDVRATVAWGFDGVKIDSCGADKNMTRYGELFNQSGRALLIENCHQGQNITDGGNPDQMFPGWCPYTSFRTSGDIDNIWDRVMSNLMTVAPFLEERGAGGGGSGGRQEGSGGQLSRPGCWAYPDMVGLSNMSDPCMLQMCFYGL